MKSRFLRSALGGIWILVFTLAVLPGTANAFNLQRNGTMTLVAVVPPYRCIDLVINGKGGTVEIQDTFYQSSGLVELEENQEVLVAISSDTGYYLQSVYWNEELLAENQRNHSLVLTEIPNNAELIITFAAIPASVYVASTAITAWALSAVFGSSVLIGSAASVQAPFANRVKRLLQLLKENSEQDP